jgi:hypothetical protein
MAEFKLGRIRFVWKGDWAGSTQYYVDDVIRYGGRTYICAVGHISASDFNTDLTYSPTKWNQMSDGQEWKGDWTVDTFYKINDIVKYGGLLYIANTAHTSTSTTGSGSPGLEAATGLETDQSKWDLYAEGLEWKGDWTTTTRYKVNDVVKYGGYSYVAKSGHTSSATIADGLEAQSSYWDTLNAGLEYKGNWAGLTRYKVNDVVKRGAGLWIVKAGQSHTSTSNWETDEAAGYWDQFVEGFEYEDTWNVATPYQQGDIVAYGGNKYISKTSHTGTTPTAVSQTDWDLYGEDFSFQSDWLHTTSYKIGEVVNLGGYTYRATKDSPATTITVTSTDSVTNQFTTTDTSAMVADMSIRFSGTSFGNTNIGATYYIKTIDSATTFTIATSAGGTVFTPTTATGTMTARFAAQPPHASYWDQLNGGIRWQGIWSDDSEYVLGDAVRYGANAYICINAHRSEADDGSSIGEEGGGAANSRPDQDVTGTYWNVMTIGSDTEILTTTGDLVYYSGAGPSRLPVGEEGQVLVSDGTYPEWATLGKIDQIYYVAPEGTDLPAPIHGCTLGKPWKSVRYACEQVEKGPRNPNAQRLLEMNRVFLQRETSSWIEAQVAGGSGIWSGFDYDEYKCERDVGFIIDRLIWDIGHGGNLKTRAAALSFVQGFSADGEFSAASEDKVYGGAGLAAEAEQSVAAYTYLQTIIGNVLANTAPAVAYQDASDSTAVAAQYIDADYTTEAGVTTTITSLMKIVTDTITAGDTSAIPARYVPNTLINVKSGKYEETLPIIVPAETCILGDEIRSTHVVARGSSVDPSDAYYTVDSFNHLKGFIGNVVSGTTVTPTSGNTATQDQSWPVADDSETPTLTAKLVDVMRMQADYRIANKHASYTTDPTGYNSSYLVGYGDARKLLIENKKFLQEEIIQFMVNNYPNLKYGKTDTREDVGHIVDALIYDLTYGGYYQTLNAGKAYWDDTQNVSLIPASILAETIASHVKLRSLLNDVVLANSITALQSTIPQFTDTAGSAAAATFVVEGLDIVTNAVAGDSTAGDLPFVTISTITSNVITTTSAHGLQVGDAIIPLETDKNLVSGTKYWIITVPAADEMTISATYGGSTFTLVDGSGLSLPSHKEDLPAATDAVSSTTALITAAQTLDAQQEALVTAATNFISTNYPTLVYNQAKCERDYRLILEAVMWDFQLNSNFASIIAGQSYLRSSATDPVITGQKAASRAAFTFLKDTILADTATYLNSDATAATRLTASMDLIDTIVFGASNEGDVCQTVLRVRDWARLKLEENRAFIKAEVKAYIDDTYSDTVTATTASSNVITISDTSWLKRNVAIRFTGSTYGGLITGTTYYVQNIVSSTTFTVATTRYAANAVALTSVSSGSFGVELFYNETLCARDVDTYIDALKWDLQWTSNYKSRYVARYYANAVLGSQEEDMYYLRNGTGIRNQTMNGLNGDLLPENEYGTSRVSAGAYCSLDPGWGPADFRTWIISRSPYVQGNTTFGNAAIGQKIDGALHNGGNDSIVSNDFTQVISDGIGAWVANNGRAELVSVFTYYSHIGYLATEGGRIRGTNGNNSYGDFGSVAEGFDATETPGTAIVDNRLQFEAVAGITNTDGAQNIYNLEFDNAGSEYQEAVWSFFGAGSGAVAEADEFRDDAVFNVRLLDNVDDSTLAPEADGNFGGFGYITNSNTAQGGTSTQITIAAVDSETSSAYVGMKVVLTGGTGVGQFGIIGTYNSGTKIATVTKESDGSAGFDHIIPGTTIVAPDASTTYTIEPRVSLTAPAYSSTARTLSASGNYDYITYCPIFASYEDTIQSSTTGSGAGAKFDITKKGTKYLVRLATAGGGYARLDTITIDGLNIGGAAITNDITITVTSINTANGAIREFDFSGTGAGGNFIVLPASAANQDVLTTSNGSTFNTRSGVLPASRTWSGIAAGKLTLTESAGNFVTGRSYTILTTGDSPWTNFGSSSIVAGTTFVATGAGSFTSTAGTAKPNAAHIVVVATGSNSTAYSIDGGLTWTTGGNLPSSTTWVDVAYGGGRFMAIETSGNATAVTEDGGVTWTAGANLPSSTTWESVAYGGGYWVAIASGGTAVAYSNDNGTTWTAGTGLSSSDWKSVTWGNGRFVAVSNTTGTKAAISINGGANWTETTLPASKSWIHVSYGQGVFLAVNSSDNIAASSPDGLTWTSRTLSTNLSGTGARASAHGNPDQDGKFVVIQEGTGTAASETKTGATARARAYVATNKIFAIRIVEPGSAYTSAPTITITDPNNTFEVPTQVRIGKGALANPSWINRGTGFSSASADLDSGDGFADIFQSGQYLAVRRLTERPAVGSNVVLGHRPGDVYKLVQVLTLLGENDGSYTAFLQVAPDVTVFDSPPDGTSVTTRIRYSQVRLTGHDFLDVGTGSFTETNYPGIPLQDPIQTNETKDDNGGRVFFTSTDQDGNFRVGDLFTIEQSTGVATLNADAFNISGLQELTLGEVTLGGNSASVTEFSTDPFFTANSDNVVPTQRAIKAYISSQIGGGGASLNVNSVTAGSIYIATNQITTTTGAKINMNATFEFKGGVSGLPIAFNYFLT